MFDFDGVAPNNMDAKRVLEGICVAFFTKLYGEKMRGSTELTGSAAALSKMREHVKGFAAAARLVFMSE